MEQFVTVLSSEVEAVQFLNMMEICKWKSFLSSTFANKNGAWWEKHFGHTIQVWNSLILDNSFEDVPTMKMVD